MEFPLFVYQVMILFFLINGFFGATKKTMVTPLGGVIRPYLPGKDPLLDTEKPILFGFAKLSTGEHLFGLGIFQLIIGLVLLALYTLVFVL